MSFDFEGLKIQKESLFNQSTGTSEPWELRGAVLRIPNFHFSEGLNVRGEGGDLLIKEGPTLQLTLSRKPEPEDLNP